MNSICIFKCIYFEDLYYKPAIYF